MVNEQIISKGVYGFSQINDFISVKNYIFMHRGEKICLAIRFSNDTDYVFDSMAFYVIQLDALGKVIGKTRVEYTDMRFKPGTTYTQNRGIIVENQCVDFKIQFCEAYSSYYRYVVKNRRVVVYYDRKKAESLKPREWQPAAAPDFTVKKKEYNKSKLSLLAVILTLLIVAGFNIYYLYSLYADTLPDKKEESAGQTATIDAADTEENLCFGVEYAEI